MIRAGTRQVVVVPLELGTWQVTPTVVHYGSVGNKPPPLRRVGTTSDGNILSSNGSIP